MKENHPSLSDNYNVSLKRLDRLKMRLDQTENLSRNYDGIFQEQIKLGIIEEVKSPGIFKNVMYFPHKEVVKKNCSTTKSVKVKGNPSLDIFYYNGPCLLMKLYDLLVAFRAKPLALKGDRKGIFCRLLFMKTTGIFYTVY